MAIPASTRPKILTFISYYLPGYKSGGSTRTVANMVAHLSDEFEFWIVTRDRDLGDTKAYDNVVVNEWQVYGKEHVLYLSPETASISFFKRLFKDTPHDILYLNSFFDTDFTVKALLSWRLCRKALQRPVVVAPRGELSSSALSLKKVKKRAGLISANLLGLYKNAVFQASTKFERRDIAAALRIRDDRIIVAVDLPSPLSASGYTHDRNVIIGVDSLKVIFLSRVAPIKNLDFAIQILSLVKCRVQFDIYGPIEDESYWTVCKRAIAALPKHIAVEYKGAVPSELTSSTFSQYDLFLFPTQGENYGHVIAESVSVGTPVLISDQTPWRDLEVDGLGWDLGLKYCAAFAEKIDSLSSRDVEGRLAQREVTQRNAAKRMCSPRAIRDNEELFRSCL